MESAIRFSLENGPMRIKRCRHGLFLYNVNDVYTGQGLDRYGEAQEIELRFLAQLIRPGMVVADVGANIGAHAVFFARAVGPAGAVAAFEPQRALHYLLCANAAMNLLYNIKAVNAALGSSPGQVTVPVVDYGQPGNFGGLSLKVPAGEGESVPMLPLDAMQFHALHLLKIDAEGMEADVIEGGRATIGRHKPIMYVENDRRENSKTLIAAVLSLGYRLWWHLPGLYNDQNYFRNPENIFGTTLSVNMLCVHKSVPFDAGRLVEITSPEDDWRARPGEG